MATSANQSHFVELVRWLASWNWALPEDAAKALVVDHEWTLQDADPGEVLGKPRRKKSAARGRGLWDLDNGAMLDVGRTTKSCAWSFTSPAFADVQRQLGG